MKKWAKRLVVLVPVILFVVFGMLSSHQFYWGMGRANNYAFAQNGPTGGFSPVSTAGSSPIPFPLLHPGGYAQDCSANLTLVAGAGQVAAPCAKNFTYCGAALANIGTPGPSNVGIVACWPTTLATVTGSPAATVTVPAFGAAAATSTAIATPNVEVFGIR